MRYLLLSLVLLTGCTVDGRYVDAATEFCKEHGGTKSFDGGNGWVNLQRRLEPFFCPMTQDRYGFESQEHLFLTLLLDIGLPPPGPTRKTWDDRKLCWVVTWRDGDKGRHVLVDDQVVNDRLRWDPYFHQYYSDVIEALRRYGKAADAKAYREKNFALNGRDLWPQVFHDFIAWIESRRLA